MTTTAAPGLSAQGTDNYKWKAFWAIALALFIMVMDFSMTGIALPTIARDFELRLRLVSWVAIAGSLTVTAVLLPLGRLADIAGRKRVHLLGIGLFAIGGILAATAPNLTMLIGARVIMAAGQAMNQAVGMAIVTSVFPAHERGKGLGMITTVVGIGAIAGPIFGGPLVEFFGWRSVFIFLAAPTAIAFVLGLTVLDDVRIGSVKRVTGEKYDWVGALTSAAALGLIIFIVNNPAGASWTSPFMIGGVALSAALFALFITWELRVASPMINLRFFESPQFTWSTVTRFLGFFGSSAAWFLMPFYIQDVLRQSPTTAGLVIFVGALGMAVTGMLSGRLSDRFGFRPFTFIGLGLATAMGVVFATFGTDTPLWIVMPALALNGIGMGLWMAPNMSATLGAVDRTNYGIVSAFLNLVRNAASVTGVAVATAIVTGVMVSRGVVADLGEIGDGGAATADAFVGGMRIAYLILAGFSLVALLSAIITRDPSRKPVTPAGQPVPADGVRAEAD